MILRDRSITSGFAGRARYPNNLTKSTLIQAGVFMAPAGNMANYLPAHWTGLHLWQ